MRAQRSGRTNAAMIAPYLIGGARLLLIYDGWCGICTRVIRWIDRHDRSDIIVLLPNQIPGLRERTGLTKEQVDRTVWAIDADGRRYQGAAAINRTLRELGRWRAITLPFGLPLIRAVEERLYHWFSVRRGRFARWGITPACARPGADCLPEGS